MRSEHRTQAGLHTVLHFLPRHHAGPRGCLRRPICDEFAQISRGAHGAAPLRMSTKVDIHVAFLTMRSYPLTRRSVLSFICKPVQRFPLEVFIAVHLTKWTRLAHAPLIGARTAIGCAQEPVGPTVPPRPLKHCLCVFYTPSYLVS